jgi:serine/threonine protein kinase
VSIGYRIARYSVTQPEARWHAIWCITDDSLAIVTMSKTKPPRRGVPQPLQGGPQRFGPYSLQARLAVGGTSEVYLADLVARDASSAERLPERIIVKRLLPHLVDDTEGRTMFEREAMLHAAMSHKNVVSVFGSGLTEQGEPYLAMEYVDGCDVFRLLRRAVQARSVLPLGVSIHITREALEGLAAVHQAKDASGAPLNIIHRDVSPSNLYLSREGDVKLGDFGIARSLHRAPQLRPEGAAQDASLLGKFSYLAPEQVAGEPFDQRADLFSMATVLTEMVIGKPLFPGTGQLQVLLAIRDCRLLPLHEARTRMPEELVTILEKALSRDPAGRFPDAASFSEALAPFLGDPAAARRELAARVRAVQTTSSETQLAAVRESARAMRAVRIDSGQTPAVAPPRTPTPAPEAPLDLDVEFDDDVHHQDTGVYPQLQSFVERKSGDRLGPWTFAHLVEAIATGMIRRGDLVDYVGMGLRPVEAIPDLARLLPASSVPDLTVAPASPAYQANLAETTLIDVLADVLGGGQSGRMVFERPPFEGEVTQRREVFFLRGRLHHLATSNAGELLGDFLVRRGKLAREELDLALAVLPRHGGRMGDTLIALGLVDGVDLFRAIREQGRDRLIELFMWHEGTIEFYAGDEVPAVDFPLDLDLATLMLEGMEACHPGDAPMAFIEPRLDEVLVPNARPELDSLTWPAIALAVLGVVTGPTTLREVLATVTKGPASGADVARALELVLAMDLVRWQ